MAKEEECLNSRSEGVGSKIPGLRVKTPKVTARVREKQDQCQSQVELLEWRRRGLKRMGYKGMTDGRPEAKAETEKERRRGQVRRGGGKKRNMDQLMVRPTLMASPSTVRAIL